MRAMVLAVVLAPVTAMAAPSFEVVDHGDSAEVIAHEMTAAKLTVAPVRSRLEVPLVGMTPATRIFPPDKTIKQIEIDPDSGRLSVKLVYEHEGVKGIAAFAKATQVGADVHLVFPRKVPAATTIATPVAPTAATAASTVASTSTSPSLSRSTSTTTSRSRSPGPTR